MNFLTYTLAIILLLLVVLGYVVYRLYRQMTQIYYYTSTMFNDLYSETDYVKNNPVPQPVADGQSEEPPEKEKPKQEREPRGEYKKWESWKDQAADNEILVPGKVMDSTRKSKLPINSVVRVWRNGEVAYAEVLHVYNPQSEKGPYKHRVRVLDLDMYDRCYTITSLYMGIKGRALE